MKVLVLGGSYFLGRRFVEKASERDDITVYNRGNRPLNISSVHEIYGDRRDGNSLCKLEGNSYDVVVDFCAYGENDISLIFEQLKGNIKQYIFISTCDVYERGLGKMLNEDAPLEYRNFGGEAGDYITGKVLLEQELVKNCAKYSVAYTSIRPAFIYGPNNYAPREGIYFQWIRQAGQILHPEDADGEFQMVYVDDAADLIMNVIGNEDAYNQAINLAPDNMENYETFAEALSEGIDIPFEKVPVTVEMVNERQIPLPFPLTRAESNYYDGRKALMYIDEYTKLTEGMKKTWNAAN